MGMIRTLGAVSGVAGSPIPAFLAAAGYTGTVIAASSFSIKNGLATIVLSSALPAVGYNGPNHALQAGLTQGGGDTVTLWGFSTATYFNGKKVTAISNSPADQSFSFYFDHADDSGSDSGNTAPTPFERYRAVRLECSQDLGSDFIYVGDLNVSSSRYMAALSLAGQLSIEIASDDIPAECLFIDCTTDDAPAQVTLIY